MTSHHATRMALAISLLTFSNCKTDPKKPSSRSDGFIQPGSNVRVFKDEFIEPQEVDRVKDKLSKEIGEAKGAKASDSPSGEVEEIDLEEGARRWILDISAPRSELPFLK